MSDTPGNEAEILGAAQEAVYAGRFEATLEELDTLLVADVPDALYMAAVCERYLKRHDAALATLARLKHVRPDFGRAFQEEGHVHRAAGEGPGPTVGAWRVARGATSRRRAATWWARRRRQRGARRSGCRCRWRCRWRGATRWRGARRRSDCRPSDCRAPHHRPRARRRRRRSGVARRVVRRRRSDALAKGPARAWVF